MPVTMLNSSNTKSAPRISGGDISLKRGNRIRQHVLCNEQRVYKGLERAMPLSRGSTIVSSMTYEM